jgi:hypothetical protein
VAVTVNVYKPVVVPGFVTPPPLLPPPQATAAAATTRSNTANGTELHRRCRETLSRKRKQHTVITVAARGHPRPDGRIVGRNNICEAACDEHVIVALPVWDPELKVMVSGAVKFCDGAPKMHFGTSTAPGGVVLEATDKVTVPVNPPAAVAVIRHDPVWPGAAIEMIALHPVETLIPDEPTVTVVDAETALAA